LGQFLTATGKTPVVTRAALRLHAEPPPIAQSDGAAFTMLGARGPGC
jgi:hypothetical protein